MRSRRLAAAAALALMPSAALACDDYAEELALAEAMTRAQTVREAEVRRPAEPPADARPEPASVASAAVPLAQSPAAGRP